jgi:hypothetical protein
MHHGTGIAFILAIGFCGTVTPVSAQTDSTPQFLPVGLHAPARVGRYVRGAFQEFGNAMLGVAYQYHPDSAADSTYATVYLYPRSPEASAWSADSVASNQASAFKAVLDIQVRRRVYDQYEIAFAGRDSVMVRGKTIPGYRVAYVYRHGGAAAVSFFYVFVVNQLLVKVRGTVPAMYFAKTDLPTFAHAVAAAASN